MSISFDVIWQAVSGVLLDPVPALVPALCRVVLGGTLLVDGLCQFRTLAGHGRLAALVLSLGVSHGAADGIRKGMSRLGLTPRWLAWMQTLSALAFMLGIATKSTGALLLTTSVLVQFCNPYVVHGGDMLARIVLGLLLFSPCGEALSWDRWWREGSLGWTDWVAPQGLRLIQMEIVLLYLSNFVLKVRNSAWRDGTALSVIINNPDVAYAYAARVIGRRAARVLTYASLVFELVVGPALLVHRVAPAAWLAAIAFHIGIAALMDVHLFSYVMIASLMAFAPVDVALASVGFAAPAPPTTAIDWGTAAGVLGAIVYVVYVFASYLPFGKSAPYRQRLEAIFMPRGWPLFADPSATHTRIEILAVTEGRCARAYHLDPRRGLCGGEEPEHWARGHRHKLWEFSLIHSRGARQLLVLQLQSLLGNEGRLSALAINAMLIPVTLPNGEQDGQPSRHIPLCLEAGLGRGEIAPKALEDMLYATRCATARGSWLLLLLAASTAANVNAQHALEAFKRVLASLTERGELKEPLISAGQRRAFQALRARAKDLSFYDGILDVLEGLAPVRHLESFAAWKAGTGGTAVEPAR